MWHKTHSHAQFQFLNIVIRSSTYLPVMGSGFSGFTSLPCYSSPRIIRKLFFSLFVSTIDFNCLVLPILHMYTHRYTFDIHLISHNTQCKCSLFTLYVLFGVCANVLFALCIKIGVCSSWKVKIRVFLTWVHSSLVSLCVRCVCKISVVNFGEFIFIWFWFLLNLFAISHTFLNPQNSFFFLSFFWLGCLLLVGWSLCWCLSRSFYFFLLLLFIYFCLVTCLCFPPLIHFSKCFVC